MKVQVHLEFQVLLNINRKALPPTKLLKHPPKPAMTYLVIELTFQDIVRWLNIPGIGRGVASSKQLERLNYG